MNERELVEYIRYRVIVLAAVLGAMTILALFQICFADEARWSPPLGMVVKSQGGECFVPTERDVAVQTCDWGPRGNDVIAGTSYFRVCKTVMEPQPFLISDYERKVFVYTGHDNRIIDGPVPQDSDSYYLRELYHDEMADYFFDYELRYGGCETK